MALKVSTSELMTLRQRAENLANRARAHMARSEQMIENFTRTAEVGASAFAIGLAEGRFGKGGGGIEVAGVPLPLGLGVLANLAAYAGVAGKQSHHLHAVGDGCLAAYLATLGRGIGRAGNKALKE